MKPEPMTVADLKRVLHKVPDCVWVCLPDGPLMFVDQELGAAEPFVVLRAIATCLHGTPSTETCPCCEDVRATVQGEGGVKSKGHIAPRASPQSKKAAPEIGTGGANSGRGGDL